jgi:hypothetical protein
MCPVIKMCERCEVRPVADDEVLCDHCSDSVGVDGPVPVDVYMRRRSLNSRIADGFEHRR